MKLRRLLVSVACVVLVVPLQAGAAPVQMDATDRPDVSGPLTRQSNECKTQRERFSGDVVAVGKTCLRIYVLTPSEETDVDRDYGVVWLQSTLNSSHGWCATKVLSDVNLPHDVTIERRVPRGLIEFGRRRSFTSRLVATANGTASTNGEVKQTFVAYPESIRTRIRHAEFQVFRLRWLGSKDKKLGFASGAEISWDEDNAPGGISFRLNYELRQRRC
ncbi:MAG: hypothetical protein ACRDKT_09985 [Actinomycetota bacterium]